MCVGSGLQARPSVPPSAAQSASLRQVGSQEAIRFDFLLETKLTSKQ
jgi:hypothetical protein